ncbi:hypothetical protein [Sulfurimonas sp.]|uniref:hypothetical protein n=1 Tax=Sulfurimonas sp. TaxID=2022749 RepID=UPI002B47F327|nr:hypothetical protein [Sulfurimonas sp.]
MHSHYIKLSTILLGTIVFLNIGSTALNAQDMKNAIAAKVPKAKVESVKSGSKKFMDAREKPKATINADWTRKNYNQDYKRGKIRTH